MSNRVEGIGLLHTKTCVKSGVWGEAFDKIREFMAQKGPRMVVMLGPRGTGKTQMACAMLRVLAGMSDDRCTFRYTRLFDVLQKIKDGFNTGRTLETVSDLACVSVLVIDEMNVRGRTEWESQIITSLLDERYMMGRHTILITNETKEAFRESIGDSVYDRIVECGRVVDTTGWPTWRKPT